VKQNGCFWVVCFTNAAQVLKFETLCNLGENFVVTNNRITNRKIDIIVALNNIINGIEESESQVKA
jgi:hypothetical protein